MKLGLICFGRSKRGIPAKAVFPSNTGITVGCAKKKYLYIIRKSIGKAQYGLFSPKRIADGRN